MTDLDLPLKGPALYNPHLLSKDELVGLFTARRALLEELLDDLRSAPPSQSAQHHLIVGQRGMGKTMLLRRIQLAVDDDPELNETWLALSFPEEQYNVAGLSDFWLNCLDALSGTLERLGWEGKVEGLDRAVDELHDLPEDDRARRALAELVQVAKSLGKRLLLLVDNADLVLDRIEDQEWALREVLSSEPTVTFLGASAAAIESTYEYGKAFYDFFRIHDLGGLNLEETRALLLQYADLEERQEVRKVIEEETGRVRTLHTLTGGNPRTVALLFNIFTQGPDGDVRTDLERLLDQCTPLYKARFEALPAQAQQVVDALALRWDPTSAGELAEELRLQVNKVSAQLNRLSQMGIVEKVPYEPATKTGFQIAERFFNIWYLMRASRRTRRRLIWLLEFLRVFYGEEEALEQTRRHLAQVMTGRGDTEKNGDSIAEADHPGEIAEPAAAYAHVSDRIHRDMPRLAEEPARRFLAAWADQMAEGSWPAIVAQFRDAVAGGEAAQAIELLEWLDLDELWRPLREALEAIVRDNRNYLRRIAVEVRKPAEELLEELTGSTHEAA